MFIKELEMRTTFILVASLLLCCSLAVAQGPGPVIITDDLAMQQPLPPPPPPGAVGAAPDVFFRAQRADDKVTMTYFAVGEMGKPVTGAPYSATAITETTQVLADGNRIVNKTESQVARDSQGRTRRQEMTSNIGPLATNAPKMAFINDPVDRVSYIVNLNDKTAQVLKMPAGAQGLAGASAMALPPSMAKSTAGGAGVVTVQKRVLVAGDNPGMEQRVWVSAPDDPSQTKTESLGTQTIEGVSAVGTRTTRTIPAGEIGNERPLKITSEVWTSPDLQMVIMSKRNDPRIGETVYKLTNIQRTDPDPSLFRVPSGFSINQESGIRTKGE
jgi:hypothetical protein